MSLYVSPGSSENGGTPTVEVNARPTLNSYLITQRRHGRFVLPNGIHEEQDDRSTLESKEWGDPPFFTNAKRAAMLERGWIQSLTLIKGEKGLLTEKDGLERNVEVIEGHHEIPGIRHGVYTVIEIDKETNKQVGNPIDLPVKTQYEEWDFYIATQPVPFVPVPRGARGGSKKRRNKKSKKTRGKLRRKA